MQYFGELWWMIGPVIAIAWLLIGWAMLIFVWRSVGDTAMMIHADGAPVTAWAMIITAIIFWPCPPAVILFVIGFYESFQRAGLAVRVVKKTMSRALWNVRHHKNTNNLSVEFVLQLAREGRAIVRIPNNKEVIQTAVEAGIDPEVLLGIWNKWFGDSK